MQRFKGETVFGESETTVKAVIPRLNREKRRPQGLSQRPFLV